MWVTKQFGYQHSSKYLVCSIEERNSYRFGITWRLVNDDNCHFGVNYPWPSLSRTTFYFICQYWFPQSWHGNGNSPFLFSKCMLLILLWMIIPFMILFIYLFFELVITQPSSKKSDFFLARYAGLHQYFIHLNPTPFLQFTAKALLDLPISIHNSLFQNAWKKTSMSLLALHCNFIIFFP